VITPVVLGTFRAAADKHGNPASTLTDNGMVFTVEHSGWGRQGGRNAFETEVRSRATAQPRNLASSTSCRRTAPPHTPKPRAKSNGSSK